MMNQSIVTANSQFTALEPEVHRRFMLRTGIIYGAIFAIGFGLMMWGPDALALRAASAYLWWGKFAVGLAVTLPLCMLIGGIAARARWTGLTILLWVAANFLITLIAGHVGYEGLSWLYTLNQTYPAPGSMFTFTSSIAASIGITTIIGTGLGLIIGLLSIWAINQAWQLSTRSNHLGFRSIFVLILGIVPVVVFAPIQDFQINSSLRGGFEQTGKVIQAAVNPQTDLTARRLSFLEDVRPLMTPNYTLYLVGVSPDQLLLTIDVRFDNGVILRCTSNNSIVGPCVYINKDYPEWMTELMTAGHMTCSSCNVQVDRATRRWLAVILPTLDGVKLQSVQTLQYQSGWWYERATFDNGRAIDCRFSGASLIVVDLCIVARP